MSQPRYSAFLALRAMVRNPLPLFVSALGLAAVLAPLLILYGLRSGILTGMITELQSDPAVLSVSIIGNRPMTDEEVAEIDAMPEVGFVVGAPRSIATRVQMSMERMAGDLEVTDWLPSAQGDPLLPDGTPPLTKDETVLSAQLAEKLQAEMGDEIYAFAYRNNQSEVYEVALKVMSILPRRLMSGTRALVASERLNSVAAFSDNYEVPELGIGGRPLSERVTRFDSVRLYAASLDDVIAVDREMVARGFRVESKAANIDWINTLDSVMTGVFTLISSAGVIGFSISLGANVAAMISQHRRELSLLRLLGMSQRGVATFPLVQILSMTTLGLGFAFVAAFTVAFIINRIYLQNLFGSDICAISLQLVGVAAVASYVLAAIIVIWQTISLRKISPTEVLADNV